MLACARLLFVIRSVATHGDRLWRKHVTALAQLRSQTQRPNCLPRENMARGSGSSKRRRHSFSKEQKAELEAAFLVAGSQYGRSRRVDCHLDTHIILLTTLVPLPKGEKAAEMASTLGLSLVRVRKWFDNRTQVRRNTFSCTNLSQTFLKQKPALILSGRLCAVQKEGL